MALQYSKKKIVFLRRYLKKTFFNYRIESDEWQKRVLTVINFVIKNFYFMSIVTKVFLKNRE